MQRLILVFVISFVAFAGSQAFAKDLKNRLGVGYSNQFGLVDDLPSIALRYYPNADYGIGGSLGVDTEEDNSRFGAMIKFYKTIFREENLNFYTALGAGLVSQEELGKTDSGFDLAGVFGAEFFLPGLDNLSFSFEGGVGVTSVSSEVRFRTVGDSPIRAGILFYF